VALVDVEAVDAKGERCPTVQQRVDFDTQGPAIWRGGYNSGKIDSINHTNLDLEAGINRVALRSTRTAGPVTLKATTEGLQPASLTLKPVAFDSKNGYSTVFPAMPRVELPAKMPSHAQLGEEPPSMAPRPSTSTTSVGHFIKTFSYSGPAGGLVHVEADARDGKNAYADLASPFTKLPPELEGADWIQAALNDRGYSAVDLMQLAAEVDSSVMVAYPAALPAPTWLTAQFTATPMTLDVNRQTLAVYQRALKAGESLTLGSNAETRTANVAAMYVVFVKAAPASPAKK
jgi:beta-galactosidase